jgi:CRISPR/Cas system CSM-associated protein Csm3 (group 7 of RAMP superfamily)
MAEMMKPAWHPDRSRQIVKRIIVQGTLTLLTPASIGNGDANEQVDLPLLVDTRHGCPLLTGSSIAGALRAYLERQVSKTEVVALFGGDRSQNDGEQSPLIVEDAFGKTTGIEIREGVALNADTRTAEEGALYNREVWCAGTTFDLKFELVVRREEKENEAHLLILLATALQGFSLGDIAIGGRKTRGYGKAKVTNWVCKEYGLTKIEGLQKWILGEAGESILLPAVSATHVGFTLQAVFGIEGSLLIRSSESGNAPDTVHLTSKRSGGKKPILTGTTLAGALRARTRQIANTVGKSGDIVAKQLFGEMDKDDSKKRYASRVHVTEEVITEGIFDLVQQRVSIDRFTGGALNSALFNQQPVFGKGETRVCVNLSIPHNPKPQEIGILLLLLKDLWTKNLPLGGERGVGRGRLYGISACIRLGEEEWNLEQVDNALNIVGDKVKLQEYVCAFHDTTYEEYTNINEQYRTTSQESVAE